MILSQSCRFLQAEWELVTLASTYKEYLDVKSPKDEAETSELLRSVTEVKRMATVTIFEMLVLKALQLSSSIECRTQLRKNVDNFPADCAPDVLSCLWKVASAEAVS